MVPLRPAPPSPKTSQCLLSFRSRTAGQARRRAGRGWGRRVGEGCAGWVGGTACRPSARGGGGAEAASAAVQITRLPGRPPWVRGGGRATLNAPRRRPFRGVPAARVGARGVRAGRGGGEGRGPSPPSPHRIPLTSGPRDPALQWDPPRLLPSHGSRVEGTAPPPICVPPAFSDLPSVTAN